MVENDKRKMCWNCEANISFEADTCPYCRASIIPSMNDIQENSEEVDDEEDASIQNDEGSLVAMTMALLMGGSFFFLFSLLLFFFSNNGYFVLRWSDSYWFLYLFVALPMLYFGIVNLQRLRINGD
ncbi:MAG: hypothetical protein H0W50_07975 [Parachlamydiaceae bacterium]|nr:hypothetical protein [Parachlamydiaceae bacterium]